MSDDELVMPREGEVMSPVDPTLPARIRQCTKLHQYGVYLPQDDAQAVGAIDFVPVWTGDLKEALLGVLDAYVDGKDPILAVRHAEDLDATRHQCGIEALRVRPEAAAQRWIAYAQTKDVIISLSDFTYYPAEVAIRIAGVDPQEWIDAQAGRGCEGDCVECGCVEDEQEPEGVNYLFLFKELNAAPRLVKRWLMVQEFGRNFMSGRVGDTEIYAVRPGDTQVYPVRTMTDRDEEKSGKGFLHYTTRIFIRQSVPFPQAKVGEWVDLELHSGARIRGRVHSRTDTTLRIDTGGALSYWHVSTFKAITCDVQIDEMKWSARSEA